MFLIFVCILGVVVLTLLTLLDVRFASNSEHLVPLRVQVDQRGDKVGQTRTEEDEVENGEVYVEFDEGAHFPDQTRVVLDYGNGGQDDHHNQKALKWIEQVEHGHTDPIQWIELELVPHGRIDVVHVSDQLGKASRNEEAHDPFVRGIEVDDSKDYKIGL